ncbi:hypothetical protein ACKLNO_09430 [Neisseriaceae bacterium B1]
MSANNVLITEYTILAETSYSSFLEDSDIKKSIMNINKKTGEEERPQSFAKYVLNHYNIVAHHADRVENGWFDTNNILTDFKKATAEESGFSATLFQAKENAENAKEYVLAIRGTAGFKDLAADAGDIVGDGIAYEQVVDLYNFYKQLTKTAGQPYEAAVITLNKSLSERYRAATFELEKAVREANNFNGNVDDVLIAQQKVDDIKKEISASNSFIEGSDIKTIEFTQSDTLYKNETLSDGVEQRMYGLGKLSPSDKLIVTGHSLGGHLAAAFALFPDVTEHAYMVNGAGYGSKYNPWGESELNLTQLFNTLASEKNSQFPDNITNIIGDKNMNFVA